MKKQNILPIGILALMFLLMIASVQSESAIIDELAHIPAGFGYLYGDYRLNPEHPPLLKTLAALSGQLIARPNFPTHTKAWTEDINGQWDQGTQFLYHAGNDADKLVFAARFPFMLLAVLFGWLLFTWTRKKFGTRTALLTLLFFAFSPTFLTHSRYVTTDLGAAFGFFIGITSFLWFLERPSWKNTVCAGLVFGVAELLKFSLVLLIPLYGMLLFFWLISQPLLHLHERIRVGLQLIFKTAVLGVVGFLLVWAVYIPHVWSYPQFSLKENGALWTREELRIASRLPEPERSETLRTIPLSQMRDAEFLLTSYGFRPLAEFDLWLVSKKSTRAFGQYLLGIIMVNQRAAGGNTQFFLGEVSAAGFRTYFPLLYLLKEPLGIHVLAVVALCFAFVKIRAVNKKSALALAHGYWIGRLRSWIWNHFTEFASLLFIVFYWGLSIVSPLNIGIRHLLPTFPFLYLLVAKQIAEWLHYHENADPENWWQWMKNLLQVYVRAIPKYIFVGVMVVWSIAGVVRNYPNFMTYFNELAGGSDRRYDIAVDSNYDWGQDLKRLKMYVEKNNIEHIAIDYFGGGNLGYYFGDKAEGWWSARGPVHGWFAISATFRQGAFGTPIEGFIRKPEDSYLWLRPYVPVARIGSIFVYKLP